MAERKIRAGYYRRYDGKVVYVVSLATDADTGVESVIWTTYPFAAVPRYYTSSKKSFCAFIVPNDAVLFRTIQIYYSEQFYFANILSFSVAISCFL